jgi:hypothetical protein
LAAIKNEDAKIFNQFGKKRKKFPKIRNQIKKTLSQERLQWSSFPFVSFKHLQNKFRTFLRTSFFVVKFIFKVSYSISNKVDLSDKVQNITHTQTLTHI